MLREDASTLASTLRAYWGARGYAIEVRIESCVTTQGKKIFFVRSDLVRGLPPGFSPKPKIR